MESSQVFAPQEENDNIIETSSLDLEAYASNYSGLAKLHRLMFIMDHCPSLHLEASKMAISYVVTTLNVSLYQILHQKLAEVTSKSASDIAATSISQDIPVIDNLWIETASMSAALKLGKLENDLKNYKFHSMKESIKRCYDELGEHYLDCGDLSNALKCFSNAQDYCSSGKNVVNVCLNVIKVAVYLENWTHVLNCVAKAKSIKIQEDCSQAIETKLKCAAGLAELANTLYKSAAKHFLQANLDNCDFPEYLSSNNVAIYGGLCALATFNRDELKNNVIYNKSFKMFLELEPQLRDIILKFHKSEFASCFKLLDEIKNNLLLDMYIAPHVKTLFSLIRKKALIDYFSPYLSADMHKMATVFNTTVCVLENDLMQLISEGQIQARIDSHKKILFANEENKRSVTFEKALLMGKEFQRTAKMRILRAAVLKSKIVVERPQGEMSDQYGEGGSGTSYY